MNLKLLFVYIGYYAFIGLLFLLVALPADEADAAVLDDFNYSNPINASDLEEQDYPEAGIFTGITLDLARFIGFVGIGVGLPDTVPLGISIMFIVWESCVTLTLIGFVITAIWNG